MCNRYVNSENTICADDRCACWGNSTDSLCRCWIATLVGAFLILTVNPFKALVFIIFLLTLQQIEGNAIYPKVVGAKINLPAMWVLAAITIGGNLAGPIGMLLGVPAAAATYALLKEATDKRETHLKTQEKEQMGNSHKQNIS